MATTKSPMKPAEIRRAQEQFELWRSGKQKRERIPANLWRMAAGLCETYRIHRVARWLRLNHTALKAEVDRRIRLRRPAARPAAVKPAFVEYSLPTGQAGLPAGMVSGNSSAEYVVEVGGRVPRIHVRGASAAEVAALVSALTGRGGGALRR
jgi:hypothetical protein